MTEERWEPIVGWPYEVSESGAVRRTGAASGTKPGLVLRATANKRYLRLALCRHGEHPKSFYVHRLVAAAFLGPCPVGHEVNHKDGNTRHNHHANLEYVTPQQNRRHQRDNGLVLRGSRNGMAKINEQMVQALRAEYALGGGTQQMLAAKYGVNQSMVSKILLRQNWQHC